MPSQENSTAKEIRISMRIDPDRKAMIARAAHLQHKTLSDFVIDHAYQIASNIVAEEATLTMTEKQFDHFCQLLDQPPLENIQRMRNLLNKKTVLDEES
jgi:uncharacterized protein (DUF1778 family)